MTDHSLRARPPLTLIANSQEWHSRSLESILAPHGHAVLRAYTGKQAIERALSARPDVIIVDCDLPDRDGFDVVRELKGIASIGACTPILMSSTGVATRQKRLDALRAGAWDFIGSTLDAEELTLKLDAMVRAKQEVDRVRDDSLLDELTGLYSIRGLARRAREIGSQAFRHKDPLACVVIAPIVREGDEAGSAKQAEILERLARALRATGRSSDAMGLLGPGELAIVTDGTDAAGIERFAERLAEAVAALYSGQDLGMAIGYDLVPNYADAPIDPTDMFTRASAAMRHSRGMSDPSLRLRIHRFDGTLN